MYTEDRNFSPGQAMEDRSAPEPPLKWYISKMGVNLFSHQLNGCGSPTVNGVPTYIKF
jgi:hypothetical protein